MLVKVELYVPIKFDPQYCYIFAVLFQGLSSFHGDMGGSGTEVKSIITHTGKLIYIYSTHPSMDIFSRGKQDVTKQDD